MAGRVISIEVGYMLTRVCEVDYKVARPKVYHCFTIQTPEGVLEDGVLHDTGRLAGVLQQEIRQRRIKTKQVVFSVTSTKIASREVLIPFVRKNKISSLVNVNAKDYFPVDLSGYQLAYNIMDTIEIGTNKQYKLLVLAAPRDLLEGYTKLATQAGLTVAAIDYGGNSIVPIARTMGSDRVTLVIKMSERSTLLTVFKKGKMIFQRNVSYGMDSAIEVLCESDSYGKDLSYEEAVRILKDETCILSSFSREEIRERDFYSGYSSKQATCAELTDSLELLVNGIARVTDYYASRNSDPIEHIYLIGLGADFKGIDRLLSTEIGMKAQIVRKIDGITFGKDVQKDNISSCEFFACVGAGIDPVDFMAEERKAGRKAGGKKKVSSTDHTGLLLFAGGLVIAVVLIVVSVVPYIHLNRENRRLKERVSKLEPIEKVYIEYRDAVEKYDDATAMYNTTRVNNENLPQFVQEMEAKMPSKVNFLSFSADTSQVVINMNADSKESAAAVVSAFRTFDSISSVDIQQITENTDELGATQINFSVICTYQPVDLSVSTDEAPVE